MAGALGREQPLDHGDRMRRRHADRLVEYDPAVHVALVSFFLPVASSGLRRAGLARRQIGRFGDVLFSDALRAHDSSFSSPGWFSLLRSRWTTGVRKSFSIRSASSNRSSTRNRTSGANFRLTRRAISPRT